MGMLVRKQLRPSGGQDVISSYSVCPADSSMRRPMHDPSGERVALTDAFPTPRTLS